MAPISVSAMPSTASRITSAVCARKPVISVAAGFGQVEPVGAPVAGVGMALDHARRLHPVEMPAERDRLHVHEVGEVGLVRPSQRER